MTDLVKRLRDSATQARAIDRAALLHEAADEIEKLRRRLRLADAALRSDNTRPSSVGGAPHAAIHGDDGRPRDASAPTRDHAASGPGLEFLSERLRILAADLRLDSLPGKFRMTMNDAADAIERLTLTDAERVAIQWVIGDALSVDGVSIQATLRSLLERLQGS